MKEFKRLNIKLYPNDHADDREFIANIEKCIPFSIIGSNKSVKVGNKQVRGRKYRWGQVEVENPVHCDVIHLRQLLIGTNLRDLLDTTHMVHYFNYRSSKLRAKGRPDSFLACDESYDTKFEDAKRSLATQMQEKENEIRRRFVAQVREKEQLLRYIYFSYSRIICTLSVLYSILRKLNRLMWL